MSVVKDDLVRGAFGHPYRAGGAAALEQFLGPGLRAEQVVGASHDLQVPADGPDALGKGITQHEGQGPGGPDQAGV